MKVICYKCGKEFEIHPDSEPHKIDNNSYCTECYYAIFGEAIEKHPIGFRVKIRYSTAKELQEQYEKDVQQLQENCKHKDISDWLIVREIHFNDTGIKVKQCNTCWKELKYKAPCEACHKEFTYVKRDWSTSQLCPTCLKIGKYYCYGHKKLHSNRRGCPKCLKMFKEAEKI